MTVHGSSTLLMMKKIQMFVHIRPREWFSVWFCNQKQTTNNGEIKELLVERSKVEALRDIIIRQVRTGRGRGGWV